MSVVLTQKTLERSFSILEEALKTPRIHEALKAQGLLELEEVTELANDLGNSARKLYRLLIKRNDEVLTKLSTVLRQIPEYTGQADTLDQIRIEEQHNLNVNGGLAVSVATIVEGKLEINEDFLTSLLQSIEDKEVYLISLNGRMRTGKSFILNQLIKYLENPANTEWIDLDSGNPMPFTSSGVTDSVTQGLQLWSKTYPVTLSDGRQVEILLLDCQGLFAHDTNNDGNALLFTLSSFLTSDLVFNDNDVLEDVLQYLDMFLKYSKAAASSSHYKPNLTFLVRDRDDEETYPFGHHTDLHPTDRFKNFKSYLFDPNQGRPEEAEGLRRSILSFVKDLELYLLPHPVPVPNADVPISQWDTAFKTQVKLFVERKLSLENIERNLKQVNNVSVSGKRLAEFVKFWSSILNDKDRLPSIGTLTEITAKVAANGVVSNCTHQYEELLTSFVQNHNSTGIQVSEFNTRRAEFFQQVKTLFVACTLLGMDRDLVWAEIEQKIGAFSNNLATINANNVRLSNERIAAEQRAEQARRDMIAAAKRERQAEQEREQQRQREKTARAQATAARNARIHAAETELTEARNALEHARANLNNVRANTTAFNYQVQIETKHRRRVMGVVVSPSYSYHTETRFNSEGYQSAVQLAESQVLTNDARVANANAALEAARAL